MANELKKSVVTDTMKLAPPVAGECTTLTGCGTGSCPMPQKSCAPRKSRRSKSCRPGKRTRNPYLNFLRKFRKEHCGLSATEVVRQGAAAWNKMSEAEKLCYYKNARKTPSRSPTSCGSRSRSRSRGQRKSKSSRRSRSRSRSRSRRSSRRRPSRGGCGCG